MGAMESSTPSAAITGAIPRSHEMTLLRRKDCRGCEVPADSCVANSTDATQRQKKCGRENASTVMRSSTGRVFNCDRPQRSAQRSKTEGSHAKGKSEASLRVGKEIPVHGTRRHIRASQSRSKASRAVQLRMKSWRQSGWTVQARRQSLQGAQLTSSQ